MVKLMAEGVGMKTRLLYAFYTLLVVGALVAAAAAPFRWG